jgi:hypothetical protein
VIRRNDSPESTSNAFFGKRGGEFRGRLIAARPEGDEAIFQVYAPTSGGADTGGLVLVRERFFSRWPVEVRTVLEIPRGFRMMLAS